MGEAGAAPAGGGGTGEEWECPENGQAPALSGWCACFPKDREAAGSHTFSHLDGAPQHPKLLLIHWPRAALQGLWVTLWEQLCVLAFPIWKLQF